VNLGTGIKTDVWFNYGSFAFGIACQLVKKKCDKTYFQLTGVGSESAFSELKRQIQESSKQLTRIALKFFLDPSSQQPNFVLYALYPPTLYITGGSAFFEFDAFETSTSEAWKMWESLPSPN
jgi:hypothetical protein